MIFRHAKRYFGQDSLEWFHRRYILDWYTSSFQRVELELKNCYCRACVGLLWFFSYIVSFWTVFERDFSPKDVTISRPHRSSQ